MGDVLGPDEDSELRRLHLLKAFGMVAGSVTSRYEALRNRDRRRGIRDPDEGTVASPLSAPDFPVKRAAAQKPAAAEPKPNPIAQRSTPEGVVSDTREIFASGPQSRRGRGIFRR